MNDLTPPCLLSELDARGVKTLALNRPNAFNALSEDLLAALQQVLVIRVAVATGKQLFYR